MDKEDMVLVEDFVVIDHNIIASGYNINGIFKIDYKRKKQELIYIFKNLSKQGRRYGSSIKYNNKIFFCPLSETYILVYDICRKSAEYIKIPSIGCMTTQRMKNEKFFPYAVWNNILFLFPWRYPAVIKLNMDTYEIKADINWKQNFDIYVTDKLLTYFRRDVVVLDKIAYLITWNNPIIIKFDMKTENFTFIILKECVDGLSTICLVENQIIMSDRKGRIYKTDNNLTNIKEILTDVDREKIVFKESFYLNGKVWLIPVKDTNLLWIDYKQEKLGSVDFEREKNKNERLLCVKPIDAYTIFVHSNIGKTYLYNTNSEKLEKFSIKETEGENKYIRSMVYDYPETVLFENNSFQGFLNKFVDALNDYKVGEKIAIRENGKKIFNQVKKDI